MGCGSGFFAVLAAKLGAAQIYAVDVTSSQCQTKKNLARNGITASAEILCGHLFEPLKGIKAQQIILDVSGVASRLARCTPWYPEAIASTNEDGTEPTISAFRQGREHLLPGGKLIFPCGTLAYERRIIEAAKELFHKNLRLLSEKLIPVTQQLGEAFDQCHDLLEKGWVSLVSGVGKNTGFCMSMKGKPDTRTID